MTPTLEIQDATLPPSGDECGVNRLNLRLNPGESAWLPTELETVAVDLACGLRDPESGSVSFQGIDWRTLEPAEAAARRHWIGRIFWDTAWVSNLDIDENITLAARHQNSGQESDWYAKTTTLASRFGLTIPPGLRPAFASRRDLQRAQYVRALLADPALLILERPSRGVEETDWQAFLSAVREHRDRGAAILWIGPEDARMTAATLGLGSPLQIIRG
jgi:ABC-type uncharacterized transport system ATPase subunit